MTPSRASTPDKGGNKTYGTNPGSQESATTVDTTAVLARLATAKDIEADLERAKAAGSKGARGGAGGRPPAGAADEKAQQALRLKLCEVLTDVLITDPALAETHDAVNRLWKGCFYGRISDLRLRLAKEKKKRKGANGTPKEGKAEQRAGEYERQLTQFLAEAIALYKFLIERYVKDLVQESMSQGMASDKEGEDGRAIIAALYRLHIHLGDLHRYAGSQDEGGVCYMKAARLAPGTGHPYNQLAVVAQQGQDLAVMALYYYARALMARREPFETSRANLVRLFESNRKRLEERAREEEVRGGAGGRKIVEVDGGALAAGTATAKQQRDWQQKEKAATTRTALLRLVDLTWSFFQGVSLDRDSADHQKIDLDSLTTKMAALRDTLAHLVGRASFGEGLLCRVVAVLAFGTLGAGNRGKLLAADGFYDKRRKHPEWNEGILVTNQALAFSFLLRTCAALAEDVDAVLAKKMHAKKKDGYSRPGALRSLSPLVLGARHAAGLYAEECQWFHGRGFFPCDGDGGGTAEGGSVHRLCRAAHDEFWRAMARLADRLEALPGAWTCGGEAHAERGIRLLDVKDFGEFRGYAPFSSFLDRDCDNGMASDTTQTKYAAAEEVLEALADKKPAGAGKSAETETAVKIRLLLAIVDKHTCSATSSGDNEDGQYFLTKNAETNEREFVNGGNVEDEENLPETEYAEQFPEESISAAFNPSPAIVAANRANSTGAAIGREEDMARVDTANAAKGSAGNVAVPLQMPYPGQGLALLTPAALLAGGDGVVDKSPKKAATASSNPAAPSIDSILATNMTEFPINLGFSSTTTDVGAFLNTTLPGIPQPINYPQVNQPLPGPIVQAPPGLAPPPGFPRPLAPAQSLAPSATGISLAGFAMPDLAAQQAAFRANATGTSLVNFTVPVPGPSAHIAAFGANQPSYPASNVLQTTNPFVQQVPPPLLSFNNSFTAVNSTSGVSQPPGLFNPAQGGGFARQHHVSNQGGLDPTLDFLLHNIGKTRSPDELTSSNEFDRLVPPSSMFHDPEDPSESILKLLFEPNEMSSRAAGRPLYENKQPTATYGLPRTKNPFAT